MNIIFIHGANATQKSFAYIIIGIKKLKHNIPIKFHYFNYDNKRGFKNNFPEMSDKLSKLDGPCVIIAHSMGGIYATHLYKAFREKLVTGITLATPYLGLGSAFIARWLFPDWVLLQDVAPGTSPILGMQSVKFKIPWIQIVPQCGSTPLVSLLANDGVVSRLSMTSRKDVTYHNVDTNHYEVLLDKGVSNMINDYIEKL